MLSQFGFVGMKWMKKIKWIQLSEIAELITKGTTPTTMGFDFQENGVNFLKIECFDENGGFVESKVTHISEECNKKLRRSQLKEGDILFSIAGAIGRVAIVTKEMLPANTNQALAIIRIVDEQIYLPYVKLILTSPIVTNQLEKKKQGVAQLNLSLKDINEILMPLPSKKQQIELADLFKKVADVIYKRNAELLSLDNLIKARFDELFGDPVSNPKKWNVKKLKDLSIQINSGNTPKGGAENYVEEGIVFFRSQNVWKDRLEMDDIAYIDAKTHASMKRSSLKHGDILMTKTGRINTENSSLGRAALYLGEDDMANVNGHVYFIRLKPEVNNKFILRILISPEYRDLIRSVCVGGIDKRQLNKEHIEDFPIICPPSDIVEKYVAFVDQVDKSKVAVQKVLDETKLLFDSLMQKYFG